MTRTLRAMLAAVCLLSLTACSGGGQDDAPEVIDPQGSEFQQALTAARARLSPAESAIRSTVVAAQVVGVREETGCLLGNKGPKGDHDAWDSECDLRRSLGLLPKDPLVALRAVDKALLAAGYSGIWYAADAKTELKPGDRMVRSTVYTNGGGVAITVQLGRTGEKQLFITNPPGASYFDQATGVDWESVAPSGSVLAAPILAVELRVPHFIRRPSTA